MLMQSKPTQTFQGPKEEQGGKGPGEGLEKQTEDIQYKWNQIYSCTVSAFFALT